MNRALLENLKECYRNPEKKFPSQENPIFSSLSPYLNNVGLSDPLTQIYITAESIEYIPALIFLVILHQIPKLQFNVYQGVIPRSKKEDIDTTAFVVGLISFLNQFHQSNTKKLLSMIGQFIRINIVAVMDSTGKNQSLGFPPEVRAMFLFLEIYCRHSNTPREVIEEFIPPYFFSDY